MLKAIENKQYIIIYHTILALTLFTNEESFRSNKILSDSFSAITSTINIYTKFILGQSIEKQSLQATKLSNSCGFHHTLAFLASNSLTNWK